MIEFINRRPGVGTKRTATPRNIWRDGYMSGWRSRGVTVSGGASRDPGNTGNINVLRCGLLMGQITSVVNSLGTVGYYAPSIIGVTTNAEAAGSTAIEASAAVVTEVVRRIGASGSFKIVGPPSANGIVASETVVYSGGSGTTLTVTAITNPYVAGALIMPLDGSELPKTFIADPFGFNIFDTDGVTAMDRDWENAPISGSVDESQIINWPSDTSIRAWIRNMLDGNAGGGKFILDGMF